MTQLVPSFPSFYACVSTVSAWHMCMCACGCKCMCARHVWGQRTASRVSPPVLLHLRQDLLLLASWSTGPGIRTEELQICVTVPNTSSWGWITLPCTDTQPFTYPFIFWWTGGLLLTLGYCTNAAMKTDIQNLLWVLIFSSLGSMPRSKITKSYANIIFWAFVRLPYSLPWQLHHSLVHLIP